MNLAQLFLQRYDPLCAFWLEDFWTQVPADLLRRRPHPRVNSLAWNLWHLARVEDAGLNAFVAERAQVLDDGDWPRRLNVPWRHHGSAMSFAEVDELSQRIDLPALRDYAGAVQARTRAVVGALTLDQLDAVLDADRLRVILLDEGLAHPHAAGLFETYHGWNKGQCLFNFGLTHPYQHVGEMGVIASLLGVEFD